MTDRELLELAADAIGITLITKTLPNWDDSETEEFFQLFDDAKVGTWNPLTDDGDALRLAVELKLNITQTFMHCYVAWAMALGNKTTSGKVAEAYKNDGNKSTRRAIVRAAAEIGYVERNDRHSYTVDGDD